MSERKTFRLSPVVVRFVEEHPGFSSQKDFLEACVEFYMERKEELDYLSSEKVLGALRKLEKFTGDLSSGWRRSPETYVQELSSKVEETIRKLQKAMEGSDEQVSEWEKKLVRLDQRVRKQQRLIRAYRKVLDGLASSFEVKEIVVNRENAIKILAEMHKYFMELQSTIAYNKAVKGLTVEELEKILDELIGDLRRMMVYVNDFETFREEYLRHILKRKKTLESYSV